MKSIAIATLLVLLTACMQKGADGAYHVRASKEDAKRTGGELKTDARKFGRELEEKTSRAADKAGDALHRAGEKLRNDASKRH